MSKQHWLFLIIMINLCFMVGPTNIQSVQGVNSSGEVPIGTPFGICHAGYSESPEEYGNLTIMGDTWVRVDFPWAGIEPLPGQWDFSYRDSYVATALSYHKKIIAILDYDVPWLNNSHLLGNTKPYISALDIPYFLDYVNHTVTRYEFQVSAFEVWNEPNGFWNGTQAEFFNLFNQTVHLIKQINSKILVVGGVVAGNDPGYIEAMFQAGLMDQVDAISFHPYSENVNDISTKIQQVKDVGDKYHYTGQYWITEVGNPTGGLYTHRVTLDVLADRVIQSFSYSTAANISVIIWYCLFDAADSVKALDVNNSELYFGLLFANYTWKPGAYAFQIFANHVSNSTNMPDLIKKSSSISSNQIEAFLYRRPNGETTFVCWYNPLLTDITSIDISLNINSNTTTILQYNIIDGIPSPVSSLQFALTTHPIVLTYTAQSSTDQVVISIQDPLLLSFYLIGTLIVIGLLGFGAWGSYFRMKRKKVMEFEEKSNE